jgi:hypothetical protein
MTFQWGNRKASRLTGEQVLDMRTKRASGMYTQEQLSREFRVSISTVRNILNYVTWQNVAYEPPTQAPPQNAPVKEVPQSQEEAIKAKMFARLEEQPLLAPKGSWYDQPPPYDERELSDAAAAKFGEALSKVKPSLDAKVGDELDKLEKGD